MSDTVSVYYSNFANHISALLRRLVGSNLFIFISVAGSFYLGLGSVPLFDLDEGAFTEATREMLASGNFAATYLDGEPRYDKPILFYWVQALSIKLLGFNEWAFRLPSVIMATLWAWAIHIFVREFFNKHNSHITTLFLINCLWVALIARSAIADATLNLFLTLCLFDIWRYFRYKKPSHLFRVYLWLALGTLTKGPVAIVIPLATSLIYLLVSRSSKRLFLAYINPFGWLIYIGVVAPWIYAVYLDQGDGFFQGFIVEHNLKRFSNTRESHGGSIFYYFLTLPLIFLPFSALLFRLGWRIKELTHNPINLYLTIWFGLIFVVFSFSKTQLPHYILNGCVPLILLISQLKSLNKTGKIDCVPIIALASILFLLPEILNLGYKMSIDFNAAALSRASELFSPTYRILALTLIVALTIITYLPNLVIWQRLSLMGLLVNMFIFTQFAQIAADLKQVPIHSAIAFLGERNNTKTVVSYKMHMPSFSVYRKEVTPYRPPKLGEIALTRIDRLAKLEKELEGKYYSIIFEKGGLLLVEVHQKAPTRQPITHS